MQQSPTKRRSTLYGAVAVVTAAVAGRKKSSLVSATTESLDNRQTTVLVDRPLTAGLGIYLHCITPWAIKKGASVIFTITLANVDRFQ